MAENFLGALRSAESLPHVMEQLPPQSVWKNVPDAVARVHAALSSLRARGRSDIADVVAQHFPKPPRHVPEAIEVPPAPDEDMAEASTSCGEEEGDQYATLATPASAPMKAVLQADRSLARTEAQDKVRLQAEQQHVAKFAARYFRITESVDREEGTKCAVWTPCAMLAEVAGLRGGRELAGNGTHFKATYMDTEFMGRFVTAHHAWLDANGVDTEDIPLRVARDGTWATEADFVMALREARRSLLRYIYEVEFVLTHMRQVFASLDAAATSGGPIAVMAVVSALDKRRRGRDDRLKLPCRRLTDEDNAFAAELLPASSDASQAAARRVLAVLHNLRVLAWTHTEEPFPGAAVLNSPVELNSRTKWEPGRERRLAAAHRWVAALEADIAAGGARWATADLRGARQAAALALEAERAGPRAPLRWASLPDAFLPVEPAGLQLTPFCDPAPEQLAGKYTARVHRDVCPATVAPPSVFQLSESGVAVAAGALKPRQQGLTIHDTCGQWVHAPGYLRFRNPEVIVEALVAATTRPRGVVVDLAALVANEATGFTRVPPAAYDAVAPRRTLGSPFEPLRSDASLEECWASRQPQPRALLRGVLHGGGRGGGRPRKNGAEDTTQYMEESTLAFACWLHYFVETRRGWLVAERRLPDEEPLSLFVLLYDDMAVTGLGAQPSFGPGGCCALDRGMQSSGDARDAFVRLDFDSASGTLEVLDGCSEVSAALVAPDTLALVIRVPVTAADAEREVAAWAGAPDFNAAALVAAAAWVAGNGAAQALSVAARGRCKAAQVMPRGWYPELHRIHLKGAGAMAAFMVAQMTLSGMGFARSDGAAGCLRRCDGNECLDVFDPRAAAAARRALFETYLLLTGGDFDFDKRCAELGISSHEYPEAAALARNSSGTAPRHRTEQLTKNNLARKIVGMGGTSWSLDADTVRGGGTSDPSQERFAPNALLGEGKPSPRKASVL